MATYEIPLTPTPQSFAISLGGTEYYFTVQFRGQWVLDIADAQEVPLVGGLPLVPGVELLSQHRHLGIPGRLYVVGADHPDDLPTFEDLGYGSRLYWVSEES
ncbi:phage baseplate plug family protein [Bordetella genomosp. 1]|uniref:Cyanophage baseplate Pam3 plug gp18 domain-containing protein n=1 Tax=Bordetella genomosp. 1 TaxID=1395607 RepID=A0ABX4EUG1_9BORD|nr:hypothetical protein [Bordetella genomosp. 1]MDQ8034970.1 hypothetical protein [Bordetella sp.]OZI57870.1 hypothetical protein CAL27_20945 [Bordetella genomosp. 1]